MVPLFTYSILPARFGRFCFILQPRRNVQDFFRYVRCVSVCLLLGSVADSRGIEGMARDGLLFSPFLVRCQSCIRGMRVVCVRVWVGG